MTAWYNKYKDFPYLHLGNNAETGIDCFNLCKLVYLNELGIDIKTLRALTGLVTLDPGFKNSGSCESGVTFLDGEKGILPIAFEVVSAFSTVGLSAGITANLSFTGKVVIMVCMFVGRIGTLTLAFALSSKMKSHNYKYPKAHLSVG